MFRLCLRYARDWPEAEDILQEAFVKVFNDLPNFRFEGPLGGWVRRVVLNTALMHVRKQQRLFPTEDIQHFVDQAVKAEAIERLDAEALTRLIQHLPPGYRAVFNLYVLDGFSHREIAEILGIDEGTSKSQLFKAKKALRSMMESAMAGP